MTECQALQDLEQKGWCYAYSNPVPIQSFCREATTEKIRRQVLPQLQCIELLYIALYQ